MTGTFVILDLLGGVALLLWGVRMVRTGMERGWGERLRGWLERRLSNRIAAFGGGLGVTAVLGSATATTLIVASLAAGGVLAPATGLAVLLGADVGSAATAAVLASGSSVAAMLAPVLIFAGYLTFGRSAEFRPRNLGRMLIGLGLMLFALKLVVGATAPLREATLFHEVLNALAAEPMLAFLAGAILTWICHSSLAVVLLLTTFVMNGSLAPEQALPFVLGLNFGGGLPALSATMGQPAAARQLPVANLLCRGGLALLALLAMTPLLRGLDLLHLTPATAVAQMHLGFNLAAAAIFLPLSHHVLRIVAWLVADTAPQDQEPITPRYLVPSATRTPHMALTNAGLETARMAEMVSRMTDRALDVLDSGKLETLRELTVLDDQLAAHLKALNRYLGGLSAEGQTGEEARRARMILHYAGSLEHAGNIIRRNLGDRARAKVRRSCRLDPTQQARLTELRALVLDTLRVMPAALCSDDLEVAKALASRKDAFRALEDHIVATDLSQGSANSAAAKLFLDILRDLHRVNSVLAAAAYPRLAAAGLMHGSRLRHEDGIRQE
ncbi:Na/Pi cotransporter family protein [Gemmobacter serpentinus]|uniref:Na/Pi cotransporter family protein n=1 Tax=Gemmobacter serpentinus TaxID=2652247 RepID=UPI00124D3365|nr:Na/Pi cotransporter family protein [Gemmobacter serpentinus]